MALSDKAIERLAALGVTAEDELRFWRGIWQSEGESLFWGFLQRTEEAAAEYHRWFPRLQAFADECRKAVPPPAVSELNAAEREQHQILLGKMLEFEASEDRSCILGGKRNRAAILSTLRVGLGAAQEVFGGSGAMILEESEKKRWFSEVYRPNEDAFWWYAFAWWTVREGLPEGDENIADSYPIPSNCSYWVVTSGVLWGSLAGGANHELWRWDGTRAEFIDLYCVDTY